ncbi:MAG: V-type ATP synthase subunit A [Methylohalobius crimeensis]
MKEASIKTPARVISVQESLITLEAGRYQDRYQPIRKNEIIYVHPSRQTASGRSERLMAEILRVRGHRADAQVFEDTRGISIGDPVEQTGEMLSVMLGPGLLGNVYDGLQNPLGTLAELYGTFLPRGTRLPALTTNQKWSFEPTVETGIRLVAGDTLGTVREGRFSHKIMVPFDQTGEVTVTWIHQARTVDIHTPIARLQDKWGKEYPVDLIQRWPIRRPLAESMLIQHRMQRTYPDTPLLTGIRLVDTFFPIACGGTACIPGPFGAGKTVLQQLFAKHAQVDIVVVIACGERAGEVVEMLQEFPQLKDPQTEGSLMERTIILCNTSAMPVAARESSIYSGITLGEYYRQMGYNVLVLADSTSRWAQAMREISGRLEEIPGEEAYPAYLESAIRAVYERAGVIRARNGQSGSLTLIGTVSPAGGNFEEPVTQATLNTVKCFLGLSNQRAYKRYYPAIDPLISWSRYSDQLRDWYLKTCGQSWISMVEDLRELLTQGDEVLQMIQVTGEEGISLDDYLIYQKALFIDLAYLQQDAFSPVDSAASIERQRLILEKIHAIVNRFYGFTKRTEIHDFFTRLTALFKDWNHSAYQSQAYDELVHRIDHMLTQAP